MQLRYPSSLADCADLGHAMLRFRLRVPNVVAEAFHAPGQYHRVHVSGSKDAHYAIASRPGLADLEYLVKRGSAVAETIRSLPQGSSVEVTLPEGPGFPLNEARGKGLLLVATGTGISPIRSVIDTLRHTNQRDDFTRLQLVYGVREASPLAFADEFDAWAALGFEIHLVASQPDDSWSGATGRVQHFIEEIELGETVAFLCGQQEMTHEVTRRLVERGVPKTSIFLNLPR